MINYGPLRALLGKEKVNMQELRNNNIINPNIGAKLNNDRGYVNLSTIDAVCNYLTVRLGRTVRIDEIVEFTPDGPASKDQQQQTIDN
ncbi:MAG TPA: hypothetical protein GX707_19685 [Epulopiscium sp.]|nr:hypothetical protein [Candidatus Epulonipiscium sp.]